MGKKRTQSKTCSVVPDGRQETPGHTTMLRQQGSASSDDVPLTPAIKLRIKIGRETVVGTKSFSLATSEQSATSTSTIASAAAADDDVDDDIDVLIQDEFNCDEDILLAADETEVTASQDDSSDIDDDDDNDDDNDDEDNDAEDDDDDDDDDKEWMNEASDVSLLDSSHVLTTRQHALLHGHCTTVEPSATAEVSATSEEQFHRRQLRARRRREKAFEKNEKDKKETLDRLLKKHDSKAKCPAKAAGVSGRRRPCLMISYIQNSSLSAISLPAGCQFPLSTTHPAPPPPSVKPRRPEFCGVAGCVNARKYSCSRTGVSLCSLACYQRNLAQHQHTSPSTTALTASCL